MWTCGFTKITLEVMEKIGGKIQIRSIYENH